MIAFLVKPAIALTLFLGIYYLLLEREKMHRFNRFYLLGALVFSLAIPFINIPIYIKAFPVPTETNVVALPQEMHIQQAAPVTEVSQEVTASAPPEVAVAAPQPAVDYLPYVIIGIYAAIAALLALRFILNIARFYRLASKHKKVSIKGATVVLLQNCPLPYTFMKYIFVSAADYENKTIEEELLAHELTHVRQRHTLDILFIELLKIVLWFNPLLYFYKKAIQMNHEFLADDRTINQFRNIPTYQKMLLNKALPTTAYALASSINFSVTKKRFVMMTKTTTKTKSLLLKAATLPAIAGLLYFLSTETVVYGQTPDTKKEAAPAAVTNLVSEMAFTDNEPVKTTIAATTAQSTPDTIVGDSRRDEYFKGVQIVIEDALRGVKVNLPYEKVSQQHKQFYLNNVPNKKKASLMPDVDYNAFIKDSAAVFYIDEQKVAFSEFLKYKQADFATYGASSSMSAAKDGINRISKIIFLFTHPFFNANMKHLNDHFPDKTYAVRITKKPVDTTKKMLEEWNKQNADGKRGYEVEQEKTEAKLNAATYAYVDELKDANRNYHGRFLGKENSFKEYVTNNIKLPEAYADKQIMIMYSVNTNGSVSNIELFSTETKIDDATKKQVEKVMTSSPGFIPSQKNGQPEKINTSMMLNGEW